MKKGTFRKLLALALALGLLLSCAASAELDEVISEAVEAAGEELDSFWLTENDLILEDGVEAASEVESKADNEEIEFALGQYPDAIQSYSIFQGDDIVTDNDALFIGWLNRVLPSPEHVIPKAATREGRKSLSGMSAKLYDLLVEKIRQVAEGELTSTVFNFTDVDLGIEDHYYEINYDIDNNPDPTAVLENEGLNEDFSKLRDALQFDFPYELYWSNNSYVVTPTITTVGSGEDWSSHISNVSVSMSVAQDYALDQYTVNDIPRRVKDAVNNINAIISENADKSDLDKLYAYANEICRLVDYNHDAADDISTPYGDPWQLISIFDGDDNTKVVCEGYSKGLKYLCDLSTFQGRVECVVMTGNLIQNEENLGPHMWNVFAMPDGYYYLVDLTNDDHGDSCDMNLFLKGVKGSAPGPYSIEDLTYDPLGQSITLFGENSPWFNLANMDYGLNGSDSGDTTKNPEWQVLQDRINAASSGETLVLTSDIIAGPGDDALRVPAGVRVTLDLAGHTLNRGLSNIQIDGCVILVQGNLTVTDSVGIGRITGGMSFNGGGGIHVESGSLTLLKGSVTGNQAYTYGGGIYVNTGASFEMKGGSIRGNKVTRDFNGGGGGVYTEGMFKLSGGEIAENLCNFDVGPYFEAGWTCKNANSGGGVYAPAGVFTMTGGTIDNNVACAGAGVRLDGDTEFTMTGGSITGNTCRLTGAFGVPTMGGGVFASSSMTINGGEISQNSADNGGGIYMALAGTVTITDGEFRNNYATDTYGGGGAIMVFNGGTLIISGGEFTGNHASRFGGAIFINGGDLTLRGGLISDNTCTPCGGGICVDGGNMNMLGGRVVNNHSDAGGGVNLDGNGMFNMSGGEISGNSTGGLSLNLNCTGTMTDGKITGNSGYGVSVDGSTGRYPPSWYENTDPFSTFTMTGGEISDNENTQSGGGIFVLEGTATIDGGRILRNKAYKGGGVYAIMSDVILKSGEISGNTGHLGGSGGIFAENESSVLIAGGKIIENYASLRDDSLPSGGGIDLSDSALTMSGGEICDNITESGPGGIRGDFTGKHDLIITGGKITGNVSKGSELASGIRNYGPIKLSGEPVITGNTLVFNSETREVDISAEVCPVEIIGSLGPNAKIGIDVNESLEGAPFTNGLGTNGNINAFFSTRETLRIVRTQDGKEATVSYVLPEENPPTPVDDDTPAPVDDNTPSPVDDDTPAPVDDNTPSPVDDNTPAPVDDNTTAPVDDGTPAPVDDDTPAPVDDDTPAPVSEDKPTPVEDAPAPAPTGLYIEASKHGAIGLKGILRLTAMTVDPSISLTKLKWTTSNKKIATVDKNGKVTGKAAGTATITVTNATNQSASYTVVVKDTHAPTSVSISSERKVTIGIKDKLTLSAQLVAESTPQTKLKWTTSDKKVAAVTSKGIVTGKAAGTAIITVTTANKLSASVEIEVRDIHAPITVSISPETPPTIGLKDKLQLTAVMTAESTPQTKLKWASSNKKVAAVDKNGRVTGKSAGTATITVTTANKKTASVTITVEDIHAPTSVRIEPASPAPIPVKGTAQLSAVVEAISTPTTKLKWTTSNKKVATVDKNGKVTGKAAGTATITVTTSNKLSASVQVTVE